MVYRGARRSTPAPGHRRRDWKVPGGYEPDDPEPDDPEPDDPEPDDRSRTSDDPWIRRTCCPCQQTTRSSCRWSSLLDVEPLPLPLSPEDFLA